MDETMHDYTFEEALQAKLDAIREFMDAVADWLEPIFKAIKKVINTFVKMWDKFTYRWYKSEGAIYGKTKKGRDRWLVELMEDKHVLQE